MRLARPASRVAPLIPEILSLRDLDSLLTDAVNRGVLARSHAAIEESRDLVPVIVSTAAYDLTWKVLEKHSFAVLDGPPEMGKTAIARAVALGHVLSEWQAIECRGRTFPAGRPHRHPERDRLAGEKRIRVVRSSRGTSVQPTCTCVVYQ